MKNLFLVEDERVVCSEDNGVDGDAAVGLGASLVHVAWFFS